MFGWAIAALLCQDLIQLLDLGDAMVKVNLQLCMLAHTILVFQCTLEF